uniref:Uncharacterized protein n=1 Tax=Glossina palpalis gambiensis TaxID=67801 RepID=A0A1B0C7C4_9MUSC
MPAVICGKLIDALLHISKSISQTVKLCKECFSCRFQSERYNNRELKLAIFVALFVLSTYLILKNSCTLDFLSSWIIHLPLLVLITFMMFMSIARLLR